MASALDFQKCLEFTLTWECGRNMDGSLRDGYTNDPNDPGGETKYGISKRHYPDLDIKNLTLPEAIVLYDTDYWREFKCDELPMPLAAVAFDIYVNHSFTSAKMLLRDNADWRTAISRRKAYRGERVRHHPPSQKFLAGWLARDNDLSKFCTIWESAHAGS